MGWLNEPSTQMDRESDMRQSFLTFLFVIHLGFVAFGQATISVPGSVATIQGAIVAASFGDVIEVAPGHYVENINFLGKAITVRGVNGASNTTLDGGGLLPVAIFVFGEGPGSVLEGFTLTNGLGTQVVIGPNGPVTAGGGIYCSSSSPIVRDCIITGNQATRGGGAEISGSPLFQNCTFSNNTATGAGGGLSVLPTGFPTLLNCRIMRNISNLYGAGIASAAGSNLLVVNCLICCNVLAPVPANMAFATGSAIYLASGGTAMIVEGSTIAANTTSAGATIGCDGSIAFLSVNNSIIYHNVGATIASVSGVAQMSYTDIENGYAGLQMIDADPMFVDLAMDDFRLSPGSPGINAGANSSPFMAQLDLVGEERVLYGAADLGAFEVSDISASPFVGGNLSPGAMANGPVLLINGEDGGADRRVEATIGQSNSMSMLHPPTNLVPSHFAVYGFFGIPGPHDSVSLPFGIGDMIVLPCPLYPWGHPLLFTFTNSTAVDVCGQLIVSHPTPWNSGPQIPVFFPLTLTFQGVVEETTGNFSVTNAIVLVIS